MLVRFDPARLDEDTTCFVGSPEERPTNPVCSVYGPWVQYFEDVEPRRTYSLAHRVFGADVNVRPGEVVNVVTFVFDTDRGSGEAELEGLLDNTGNILGGVAQIVAGAYGAEGIGDGAASVLTGVFSITNDLIAGLEDPELIALTVTSYTAQDLALLTLAAQMGLSPQELLNTGITPLAEKPLFETVFQGVDYDITETLRLPAPLTWGRHREIRRFEAQAPDAREIGCIREALLNSCAYRGHSTYEIEYSLEHLRSAD